VVRSRGNHPDLDPVLGVPSGKAIKYIDVLSGVQVVDRSLTVDLKGVLARGGQLGFVERSFHSLHLDVHRSPPDVILAGLLENDSLVLGTPARLLAGKVDECAT
jgi:hypothetical protein